MPRFGMVDVRLHARRHGGGKCNAKAISSTDAALAAGTCQNYAGKRFPSLWHFFVATPWDEPATRLRHTRARLPHTVHSTPLSNA